MTDLATAHVLVTGAASGLGRMMAERAAADGATVILWDIDAEGLAASRSLLEAGGATVHTFTCNLADRDSIAEAASATLAECGRVDVLINNAGIVSGKTLLELSDDQIELTFAVNTLALFRTTRAFLPGMIERGRGHIVTIASAGGIVGTARLTDYCSSKFAAVGFDDALRLELKQAGHPVVTTVVCPFYIDTGMFEGVRTRFPRLLPILKPQDVVERIMQAIRRDKRRVVMPWLVFTSYLARVWPVGWFDGLMSYLGINRSMDEFTGRS